MKRMRCRCGRPVFFDNHACLNCGRALAFDPDALTLVAETQPGAGLEHCANRGAPVHCNWRPLAGSDYCLSCAMSQVVPALSQPENHLRWQKLEAAKRRLLYDLLRLGLPVDPAALRFEFKEDRRTNPNVSEHHVATGHAGGIITINAAEADELFREEMRLKMNEPWRTLVGHFRHESGHYYFGLVIGREHRSAAREVFGDERADYDAALERYYRDGPPPDWQQRCISAYAAAHPAEDWAECWAHYLHIRALLEAAAEAGVLRGVRASNWYGRFIDLVLALNEMMRALGLP
ncbi:MAG: putative zinc-binding metallopeptidase, partial [Pseudomonadota bacterium]